MTKTISSLESDIVSFANDLPYWGRFLSEKILHGIKIDDTRLADALTFLLEDLAISPKSARPEISLSINQIATRPYRTDVYFSKLSNVEGVNAIAENQTLEFSPNLTVVFGNNGCGKSGYTRILKKAFYSKTPEEIHPNIYKPGASKSPVANFTFRSATSDETFIFPTNASEIEFRQFAVFDGKSVIKHLENKNQFEFRPSGLNFFGTYTDCIRRLESLLAIEIGKRHAQNNFPDLFDGESEIKVLVSNLSAKTDLIALKKYISHSGNDTISKIKIQKEFDEHLLASKSKERENAHKIKLKAQIEAAKLSIANLNRFFSEEHLNQLKQAINDCAIKEEIAQKEGIANFATDIIQNIGSPEWREFIAAAQKFAELQNQNYPDQDYSCIFCHQELSPEAKKLINNYWSIIKSIAEKEAKDAQSTLEKGIIAFEKLNFVIFQEDATLTHWLTEFHPRILESFHADLTKSKELAELIIKSLREKKVNPKIKPLKIEIVEYDRLLKIIDDGLQMLSGPHAASIKYQTETRRLLDFYSHKEKLALHFDKIEKFVESQIWIAKAAKVNWAKRAVTETEKSLSAKYFNQTYIDTFNEECKELNGNFGIVISHTGAGGTSYKQLFIEGWSPAAILSEGEQNVIGLSDFLAEMRMSEINRGVIFDDPVTSLDHERKVVIANRLVEMSRGKQVIVFTHDIFFLTSLISAADKHSIPYLASSLYKVGENVGVTKPSLPWIASTVKIRNGFLKNELQRLTKLYKTADPDLFRFQVKAWCGLLREAWERSIEERLFKGVINRFSFPVETQKLKYVNITTELVNDITKGMTNTSKWVHDQSMGVNTPNPTPIELENLMSDFETFINKCQAQ